MSVVAGDSAAKPRKHWMLSKLKGWVSVPMKMRSMVKSRWASVMRWSMANSCWMMLGATGRVGITVGK